MISWFKYYFSSSYLLTTVTATKYERLYLYLGAALLLAAILAKIFIVIKKKRPSAYKEFDRYWFWGYLALGLSGLFIWFSRYQALPIFSTRIVSYLWVLVNIALLAFLAYYFLAIIPGKLNKYYENRRKKKYLGK